MESAEEDGSGERGRPDQGCRVDQPAAGESCETEAVGGMSYY